MMKVDICSPVWKLLGNGGRDQAASGAVQCNLSVCLLSTHSLFRVDLKPHGPLPKWTLDPSLSCPVSNRSWYRISTGQEAVLAV